MKRHYPTRIVPFSFSPQRLWHILEHIFNKDAVARGGVADQHVRHRANEASVLQDRATAHECGQVGTTAFLQIIDRFDTVY